MLRLVVLVAALVIGGGARAEARHHQLPAPGRADMVELVAAAARRHGVPGALQFAVVETESGFDPRARNGISIGLGQIKPDTARDAGGDWRRAAAHYNQGRYAPASAGAGYARLVLARAQRRVS